MRETSLLKILLFLAIFTACSTPDRYVSPKVQSEKINLSEISLESTSLNPNDPIPVFKSSDGKNYLLLNLVYNKSGISVIEAIRNGEIQENKIIVRDHTGKIIGSDVINFQGIISKESKNQINSRATIQTLDGLETLITTEQPKTDSEVKPSFEPIFYNDKDKVPQAIKLNELPSNNSYVSIHVLMTYVQPYLSQVCKRPSEQKYFWSGWFKSDDKKTNEPCLTTVEEAQKDVKIKTNSKISKLENDILKGSESNKKFALTEKETTDNKKSIKTKVNSSGATIDSEDGKKITSVIDLDKAKVNYREWVLVSEPKYFQLSTDAKPNKVVTTTETTKTVVETTKTVEVLKPSVTTISNTKTSDPYTDTVITKDNKVFKSVKTYFKDNMVIIETRDGQTFEFNKSDVAIQK